MSKLSVRWFFSSIVIFMVLTVPWATSSNPRKDEFHIVSSKKATAILDAGVQSMPSLSTQTALTPTERRRLLDQKLDAIKKDLEQNEGIAPTIEVFWASVTSDDKDGAVVFVQARDTKMAVIFLFRDNHWVFFPDEFRPEEK